MFIDLDADLAKRSSLMTNRPVAPIDITNRGSDWAWAVFAVMAASTLGMIAWRHMRAAGTRIFHNLAIFMLIVSTICWFGMASDLGQTGIQTEFTRGNEGLTGPVRAIWYVKYIQYFINFPILLTLVLLATGMRMAEVAFVVFLGIVTVVCGLVGALVPSSYKWGFYTFGTVALLYIIFHLWGPGRRAITHHHGANSVLSGPFSRGAGMLTFLLLLYPIAWGVSEGGNVISPDSEFIFYGILDILTGPVFLFMHIYQLAHVDFSRFGWWGEGANGTGAGYGGAGTTGAGYGNNTGMGTGVSNGAGMGTGVGTGVNPATGVAGNTGTMEKGARV